MPGAGKEIFDELYFVDPFGAEGGTPPGAEDEGEGEESRPMQPASPPSFAQQPGDDRPTPQMSLPTREAMSRPTGPQGPGTKGPTKPPKVTTPQNRFVGYDDKDRRIATPENDEDDDLRPDIFDPLRPEGGGPLEETWWLLEKEGESFSDIYEKAGDSLDDFFDYFHIYPIRFEGNRKIFLARYDFPQFNKEIQHPDGKLKGVSECLGFIDFLGGFPLQNQELLTTVGEWSSREEEVDYADGSSEPAPPIPDDFFEGYEEKRMLLTYFYLDEKYVESKAETLADDLKGEPKPEGLHWWIRINLKADDKYPMPGEFLALAARQWCALPWGEQESSPYIFAGNWMDTVYYTGGKIKAIDDSGDFPKYLVQWRKHQIILSPTDFAEYKIGDRVTILKKVPSEKQSQLWRDDDTETPDEENWVIAPLMFYDIKAQGDGG